MDSVIDFSNPRVLCEADVQAIVDRAYDEGLPLLNLMNEALWGTAYDPRLEPLWGELSDVAKQAWDLATMLFRRKPRRKRDLRASAHSVTVPQAWAAVLGAIPDGTTFPCMAFVKKNDFTPPDGISRGTLFTAIHEIQYWRFRGRGPTRRCVRAPCIVCEKVRDAVELKNGVCPDCRG